MMRHLRTTLEKRGVDLKVARASAPMIEILEKTGLKSLLDQTDPGGTVTQIIEDWQNQAASNMGPGPKAGNSNTKDAPSEGKTP